MLVYVSGKYSAPTHDEVQANIDAAAVIAKELWQKGHAVICPHLNTAHFEIPGVTYEDYIKGDLNMVRRCDAMVMVPGWKDSRGACEERAYAEQLGIPIYHYPTVPEPHPVEVRCPVQVKAFMEQLMKQYRVHLKKNKDYSSANIAGTGEIGLVTRLWDKMARLMSLTGFRITITESVFDRPQTPENESIDDTYLDLANYGVIAQLYKDGKWGK